jgi:hypothetical protein
MNFSKDKIFNIRTIAFLSITCTMFIVTAQTEQTTQPTGIAYKAELQKIPGAPIPDSAKGIANLNISGDSLIITVNIRGLTQGKHEMHIQQKKNNTASRCPTMDDDKNGDGLIDDREADSVSGEIHIPLTENSVDLKSNSYPSADENGVLLYKNTISLKKLQEQLKNKKNVQTFNIDSCVVEIHGISKASKMPASVRSSGLKPSYETIPVLCGKIQKVL